MRYGKLFRILQANIDEYSELITQPFLSRMDKSTQAKFLRMYCQNGHDKEHVEWAKHYYIELLGKGSDLRLEEIPDFLKKPEYLELLPEYLQIELFFADNISSHAVSATNLTHLEKLINRIEPDFVRNLSVDRIDFIMDNFPNDVDIINKISPNKRIEYYLKKYNDVHDEEIRLKLKETYLAIMQKPVAYSPFDYRDYIYHVVESTQDIIDMPSDYIKKYFIDYLDGKIDKKPDNIRDSLREIFFSFDENTQILLTYFMLKNDYLDKLDISQADFHEYDKIFLLYLIIDARNENDEGKKTAFQAFLNQLNYQVNNSNFAGA